MYLSMNHALIMHTNVLSIYRRFSRDTKRKKQYLYRMPSFSHAILLVSQTRNVVYMQTNALQILIPEQYNFCVR